MRIEKLSGTDTLRRLDELAGLLADAVAHGASLGFNRPLDPGDVKKHLADGARAVAASDRQLFVAVDERGRVQGSAELAFELCADGQRCAMAQKIIVRHVLRGHGIGTALLARVEQAAGHSVVFLDAGPGTSGATAFCRRLGYSFTGSSPQEAGRADDLPTSRAIFSKSLAGAPSAEPFDLEAPRERRAG